MSPRERSLRAFIRETIMADDLSLTWDELDAPVLDDAEDPLPNTLQSTSELDDFGPVPPNNGGSMWPWPTRDPYTTDYYGVK